MPPISVIDVKDRAILYYLDQDARQSISKIAKKTKLSKEVVNYRIKKLQERGIIQNFCAVIDNSKLGYVVYRVFIRFQHVDIEKEQEILEFLRNFNSIGWVIQLEELYDVVLLIWAKNIYEFKDIFDDISLKYGAYFRKRLITVVTEIHHFTHNYLYEKPDLTIRKIGGKFEEKKLDQMDYKILSILAQNARAPLLQISQKLKVSPNTIKHRIKKMTKEKVIVGYRTRIDASLLGYQHYKIFLGLTDTNPEKKIGLKEYLRLNNNVTFVTEAIGRADLEFEIKVKDSQELHQNLKGLRQHFGSLIKDYRTTLVNNEYVVNYFPIERL